MDILSFIQTLATLLAQYWPEEVDPSLKPIDSAGCLHCRNVTYDFIIVGAGSAGCALANRLSENHNWKILLIEAGIDEDFLTDTPGLNIVLLGSRYDWNYTLVPQKRACGFMNTTCIYPRGKVMGGSSTLNAMIYNRGPQIDYNEWEAMGNHGWSYSNMIKYFLRLENMTIPGLANSPYHSTKGPQSAGYSIYRSDIIDDLIQAGVEYGLNVVDYNGRQRSEVENYSQKTIRGPTRCSTSKAYLDPIRDRENLVIFKNTEVIKILFDNGYPNRAVGVQCVTNGSEYSMYATREVILSAGAINTPKLLMLSGIGPREHLEELGIPILDDKPEVGILTDHPVIAIGFHVNTSLLTSCTNFTYECALEYAQNHTGPMTTNQLELFTAMNQKKSTTLPPDILTHTGAGAFTFANVATTPDLVTFLMTVVNPCSTGTVRLANANWRTPPLIDPNYYADLGDLDLAIWGVREVFKFVNRPAMVKYSPEWIHTFAPTCDNYTIGSNDHLKCYVMYTTSTLYHPFGTARMGPISDQFAVVDPRLKLHGFNGLRIVDASIIPKFIRGNPNAPTIAIAEKAADLIKEDYGIL